LGASQLATGGAPILDGRRQPSCGGTSRMTREYQVRICERLGVKFPGPTRPFQTSRDVRFESAVRTKADIVRRQCASCFSRLRQRLRMSFLARQRHRRSRRTAETAGDVAVGRGIEGLSMADRTHVRRGRRSSVFTVWLAIRSRGPIRERWRSFVKFYRDVDRKPSWRHLLIRDDPTGKFGPSNARWRLASRYRWRPTARTR
jgi:hypothetical protein